MTSRPERARRAAAARLKPTQGERIGWWPLIGLALLGASLYVLGVATENTARFGKLYSLLLLLNAGGLVLLFALIGGNLFQLVRQYRHKAAGSQLRLRLVVMFVLLAVIPVLGVYYYSLQFLHRGIDSWFDVRVDQALNDALELSRSSLEVRMRELLRRQQDAAADLVDMGHDLASLSLGEMRNRLDARELALLGPNGSILGAASADPRLLVPDQPEDTVIQQVKSGQAYAGLDPVQDDQLNARIVVPVTNGVVQDRMLQGIYPMPKQVRDNARRVEAAISGHQELAYLRTPLKFTFTLTLSLVLSLSLAFAVWAAFFASRRLSAPIQSLAEGTRAVAEGDYSKRLPLPPDDEMGALVQSFNAMTLNIALARDAAARSKREVEIQRAYLETLLARLSSGVLSLDARRVVHTVNRAAGQILEVELTRYRGWPLSALDLGEALQPFVDALAQALDAMNRPETEEDEEWREEVEVQTESGHKILLLRGARLAGEGGGVIVFDDVTAIARAQRNAAWAEVARRLAHEIKNPLTPIQLSAERLRRKCLDKLQGQDAELFDRGTRTIVRQVEAMKTMVNDFNEFARPARGERAPLDLGRLLDEIADLYKSLDGAAPLRLHDAPEAPLLVRADSGQLRQVLHNLLTNAREATEGRPGARIDLYLRPLEAKGLAEIRIEDNGPGFGPEPLSRLFEPYVTSKPGGTGLGLAIVKKIVGDHGGILRAENRPEGGARMSLRLPLYAAAPSPSPRRRSSHRP